VTAIDGAHLTFDPSEVVLDESKDTVEKNVIVLLKYLRDNPEEHITIFSSASYSGERVS
jgi:hypothetical protein